jgi:hypothetical protein
MFFVCLQVGTETAKTALRNLSIDSVLMSSSQEIIRLRGEAELLRAVTVEKGVRGRQLDEGGWDRICRATNLPTTTCKYVTFPICSLAPDLAYTVTDLDGEWKAIA